MAALYQMMVNGGRLHGTRLFSRRLIEFVTRNHTGDMVDETMGMPMHRGLGVHVRGTTETIRGLGSLASPRTYGHGGVGSSYCWGDPGFRRVVRLHHQQQGARPVAQRAARPGGEHRAFGDRLK